MSRLLRFPLASLLVARYGSLAGPRSPQPRRPSRLVVVAVSALAWLAVALAAVALHRLTDGAPLARLAAVVAPSPLADRPSSAAPAAPPTVFTFCGPGARETCVVDGDTFRLAGTRIRIADIDTPELSPPRCEAERVKGEAAKRRLLALLSAGPFTLATVDRDEDRYGRKLRRVMRDGRSLGDVLVAEGLARRWEGRRRSWCS